MKKSIVLVVALTMVIGAILFVFGFYPVAIVDGTMITRRTSALAEFAARNFANAEFRKTGMQPIDFALSANTALRRDIGRGSLTFLIEDAIIKKKGASLVSDFDVETRKRVQDALRRGNNIDSAAKAIYGLSLEEFRTFVLEPQARRDIAAQALVAKNQDFFSWMSEQKKRTPVRMLFTRYKWKGSAVE